MQSNFKYFLVMLLAVPFGIRAESEDAIDRKCCNAKYKNLCVRNLATLNSLNVCNGSILNGPVVMNSAVDTTCLGCNRTIRACTNNTELTVNGASIFNGPISSSCPVSFTDGIDVVGGAVISDGTNSITVDGTCVNVEGCFTVNGSPAGGATGPTGATGVTGATGSGVPVAQVHQFYNYIANPTQFSGVNANTTNVVVFQTYQTINWGTFSTNTLYLSMVVSGADDGNPINFTLELGNGPTPITNPFVDFANFGPIYSAVEWNQGAAASYPATGNWSGATEFNIIIQGGYPVGQTSCNICCFVLTWTS